MAFKEVVNMWKKVLTILLLFTLAVSANGEVSMANKYCNLQGGDKIRDSYTDINTGFDALDVDISALNADISVLDGRVDTIITTPISGEGSAQELIDARGGSETLGARLDGVDSTLAENTQDIIDINTAYSKFVYPEEFSIPDEFKIDLFKYGGGYNTNFDIRSKKNKSGSGVTYYVAPDGDDSNDGLTVITPLLGIDTAIAKADVETVILLEGDYFLNVNYTTQLIINKSINLIGRGKVRIINGISVEWAVNVTYPNVYQVAPAPSGAKKVISLDKLDDYGDELGLTKKTALSTEVALIPFTYAIGSNLYIHLLETPTAENILVLSDKGVLVTDSVGATQINLYMENITIIGGASCITLTTQTTQEDDNYLYAYNCKFLHSTTSNILSGLGGNYYMVGCIAAHGSTDGFNYHCNTTAKKPNVIEINCIARYNGETTGGESNNGSTIHDGGNIIRLNGDYFESQVGNVTDAYAMSVNLNCKAHDSIITDATRAGNFVLIKGAATTAKMWVIDCLSYGSVYDLVSDGDANYAATIYQKNNQLLVGQNNLIGTGTIEDL
jgi:hypothetical protein